MTPQQRAERDARLATARRMTDQEAADFKAKVNEACERYGLPPID